MILMGNNWNLTKTIPHVIYYDYGFFSPCDKVNFILEACKKINEWMNEWKLPQNSDVAVHLP